MSKSIQFFLGLFFWMLLIPLTTFGEETRPEGWPVPDLKELIPYSIVIRKTDGVEKIVEKFYTPEGGHVARISGNGRVFAYAVDKDQEPPIDYLLLDLDGSGKFTKRLNPRESYAIPDWVFH